MDKKERTLVTKETTREDRNIERWRRKSADKEDNNEGMQQSDDEEGNAMKTIII